MLTSRLMTEKESLSTATIHCWYLSVNYSRNKSVKIYAMKETAMDPGRAPPRAPTRFTHASEGLPPEIWHSIFAYLLPGRPSTWQYHSSSSHVNVYERHTKHGQWETWAKQRQDLVSLSWASKGFAAITTPYLYCSIVLTRRRQLKRLLELLTHQSRLGRYVRELCCLFSITAKTKPPSTTSEGDDRSTSSEIAMLESLLISMPNVTALLLVFPMRFASMADASPRFHNLLNPSSSTCSIQGLDLGNLKSLCIRADFTRRGRGRDIPSFSCDISKYLPHLTSLETLEVCADGQRMWTQGGLESWLKSAPEGTLFRHPNLHLPQLKHLRLYASRIREAELIGLCLACTSLQSLLVHFEMAYSESDNLRLLPHGRTLNTALLLRSETLRSLELLGPPFGHFLIPEESGQDSKSRKVDCVRGLVNLQHLTIDFRSVYGRPDFLTPVDVESLSNFFPPSLKSLEIVCIWGWAHPAEHELDWDDSSLTFSGLASLHRKGLLPRQLSHLTVATSSPLHASQTSSKGDSRAIALDQARSYFATTAIEFEVADPPGRHFGIKLNPCESDEEWAERRFDENDRRLLLRVAGLEPPLYKEA